MHTVVQVYHEHVGVNISRAGTGPLQIRPPQRKYLLINRPVQRYHTPPPTPTHNGKCGMSDEDNV